MELVIVATILGGLVIDQYLSSGQLVVNAIAWVAFFALWTQTTPRQRPALALCLAFATAGEVFLSLVWGLYEYRLGNIPLFVPPGHVLLFALGMRIAAHIPDRFEWFMALLALPVIAAFSWIGRDTLGPILYGLFIACMALSPSRKLYATMFMLSLGMEVYGTWLGNWTWAQRVPWLGLAADNPPIAAGAFYCVLDLLVVTAASRIGTGWGAQSPARPGLKPITPSHQAATCSARSSSR